MQVQSEKKKRMLLILKGLAFFSSNIGEVILLI